MRKIYTFLVTLFLVYGAFGQVTIFSENMGAPASTTAIAAHTFQNSGTLTYADGGAAAPADVRATSASAGYTGASGTGNVFFTSTAGDRGFSIESINASAYTNLQVQFGYRKESGSVLPTFAFSYWDGAAWQAVPFTFNEAANAAVAWYLSPVINLPVAAQINGLKLRWVKSGTASTRLDDVKLTGTLAAGTSLSASSLAAFGNVCINTTSGPNSFTITGNNLTTADVTVASLAGFTFSTTAGGTYTSSLTLSQPGGAYSQAIFVQFSPTAVQSYDGNIVVGGGGATDINVAASGSGVNTAPTVTAGGVSNITGTTADVAGTITVTGCSAVTAYGIEYSTTDNFTPGTGTQVAGGTLTAGAYTSNLTGLTAATIYYYRAYATNSGGTSYSAQSNFTTLTPEPTNHATGFACGTTTATTIQLTWTDAAGGTLPSGYLIKWSSVSFAAITDPVDGTPESNGAGILNIASGLQAGTATSLLSATTYFFKIFPYTNSGALIDYKIDGTVPQTSCVTGAGPIAAWDFTGLNTVATATATTFNANLVSGSGANDITRGAGAAASAGANSFRTTGFQNNGISTANTDYFQVTLTAQPGFELSLSTIDANLNGTGTYAVSPGVSNQFAYSLDGTNFTLIGSPLVTIGQPVALPTIDLTGISALQNVSAGTTITLRYYASGQTTTGGWGFFSSAAGVNGLAIGGTLNVSATPSLAVTPASLTFGQQAVGSNSTSQSVDLSGVNLTGFPDNITVTVPSADFQVSNDNNTWGAGTTIAYNASTLSATPVYIRFTPQSSGAKSGNVTFSGGGDVTPPTVAVSGTGTITYYSKAAGDLTDAATWGPNTDGTGVAPANFTADAQVFTVANRTAATLNADWIVSGTGSKIVIGDGVNPTDLTIAPTLTITGAIDISAQGELTIENTTVAHTYGTLATGSTIEYAQAGTFTVPNTVAYSNLKLTGGTKTLSGNTTTVNGNLVFDNIILDAPGATPFATIDLNGNLTYLGTVTNPADASSFTLIMNGGGTQTIDANGNTVRVFRLTATGTTNVVLTTAETNVLAGNLTSGGIEIGAGSSITVNSNTITTFAGSVRINGTGGNTGTFITNGSSNFNLQSTNNSNSTLYFDATNNVVQSLSANFTGTGVLVIGSNAEVTGVSITAGKIQIAENATLYLNTALNLGGVYDNTKYFVTAANATTGAKGFFRVAAIPAGDFTFPVGTATSYLPVTVNPTATSDFSVNTFQGITGSGEPNGTAFTAAQKADVVDAVWIVNRNAGAGDVTMTTAWPAALEGSDFTAFADAEIGIARHDGSNWTTVAGTGNNTANTATRTAISAFSPFGVGRVGQILPVKFGFVKATQQFSGIKVEWSNLTELDVINYSVERSADGRNFTAVGSVNARLNNGGKADYSFMDANPLDGVNFYRIKSLETDSRTRYSIIVKVDTRGGATQLVLYPNPSTGEQISYQAVNLARGKYTLRIFNAMGQQVYTQALNHAGGSVSEAIPLPAVKAGIYSFRLSSDENIFTKTFIVR